MNNYVHVYTGDGKGKTTAAIGLAIRAAGAKKKVLFTQFVKGMKYSEIEALKRFDDKIFVKQYGRSCFIKRKAAKEDVEEARKGLEEIKELTATGEYQVLILDEANIALYYSLFHLNELLELVNSAKTRCEIIITGRYAPQELIEYADLVTEMREIKHYYKKGVSARVGIER